MSINTASQAQPSGMAMLSKAPSLPSVRGPVLQRKCACGTHTIGGGACDKCSEKQQMLQRRPARIAEQAGAAEEVPSIVNETLRSSGQPLDAGVRSFMESRFNHDFSRVRIHTDARAAESAQAVNALAYTVGSHIVFGGGQYAPSARAGRRLIAHELTHTIQQGRASSVVNEIGQPAGSSEHEASQTAERVISGVAIPLPILDNETGVVRRQIAANGAVFGESTAQTDSVTPGDAVFVESQPEEKGGEEPKETEMKSDTCQSTLTNFGVTRKGAVNLYAHDGQLFVQAGMSRSEDPKENKPGVRYIAAAELNPKDCANLEFVQNIQAERVITFKDASKLELIAGPMLDGENPWPAEPLGTGTTNNKIIGMNDSPSQGTGGVFGLIDTLSIIDSFKLFVRVKEKGKKKGRIIGLANWDWKAKAVTEDKNDDNALLKIESGEINAPNGSKNDKAEEPKLSPRIQDQPFKVVGKGDSYASKFRKFFKPKK